MTDEELKAMHERGVYLDDWRVLGLVAEVRRLRGLIKDAELAGDDVWNGETVGRVCPWCRTDGHDADCPAFAPDGAVR